MIEPDLTGRTAFVSGSAIVTPAEMIHDGVSKTALLAVSRGVAKGAAGTGRSPCCSA